LLLTSRNLPCKDPWYPKFHITYSSIAYIMTNNFFMTFHSLLVIFFNQWKDWIPPPIIVVCIWLIQHIYSWLLNVEPICITSYGYIVPEFGQRT
jgi:hypothetical protein